MQLYWLQIRKPIGDVWPSQLLMCYMVPILSNTARPGVPGVDVDARFQAPYSKEKPVGQQYKWYCWLPTRQTYEKTFEEG